MDSCEPVHASKVFDEDQMQPLHDDSCTSDNVAKSGHFDEDLTTNT